MRDKGECDDINGLVVEGSSIGSARHMCVSVCVCTFSNFKDLCEYTPVHDFSTNPILHIQRYSIG